MTWTVDAVLERLIYAYRVIEVTIAGYGPSGFGRALPPMCLDPEDRYTGKHLDDVEKAMKDRQERRAVVAAGSISMAEEAQRWPLDYLVSAEKRECLIEYASCRARNGDWSKHLQRRNRLVPKESVWLRRKTYRWNEQSLQRIADELNNKSVLLRPAPDGQVTHETAEPAGEFATVGSYAWRAKDAIPRHTGETKIPAPRKNRLRPVTSNKPGAPGAQRRPR